MADQRKSDRDGSSEWLEMSALEGSVSRPSARQTLLDEDGVQASKNGKVASLGARVLDFLRLRRTARAAPDGRRIPLRLGEEPLIDERTGRPYISNRIRTSRYTIWNFVPRQLIYQFSRLANMYFLIIAILQMIPGFSTTGRFTTLIPLLIFVALTIAKEGYDDWKRYTLDKAENASKVTILGSEHGAASKQHGKRVSAADSELALSPSSEGRTSSTPWTTTQWGDLKVGDIVKLLGDEQVPADIVLLYADEGVAFVDTRALDGETNLKSKMVPAGLKKLGMVSVQNISTSDVYFTIEHPNQDLYNFDGTATVDGSDTLPLNVDNIIYRGCEIKNTRFIIGMVINTGEDTKIRMNANRNPEAKRPALEKFVNLIVIFLALYMLVTSVLLYMGFKIYWQGSNIPWYLMLSVVSDQEVIIGFIIQFSNVVPMSLIMAIEAVKLNLAVLVASDVEMHHEESDTPAGCNTNIILDDLGQIGYVFSDKTGTLTDNIMKFRRISVAGTSWWHEDRGLSVDKNAAAPEGRGRTTDDLVAQIRQDPRSALSQAAYEYILALAVCHTCLPEKDPETGEITDFQASSPDELALVRAAQELGILVIERSTQSLTLEISHGLGQGGRRETYEVLDVIEFSSKRKRMSIVVRRPDGRLWVICKGADTIVLPRLRKAQMDARRQSLRQHQRGSTNLSFPRRSLESPTSPVSVHTWNPGTPGFFDTNPYAGRSSPYTEPHTNEETLSRCLDHIDEYAREGLRTLVFAHRYLSDEEYRLWKREYHDAQVSLTDRQKKLEEVGEKIEHSFDLIGASGVEDKLQKGVPETIDRLRRARIKIWMLTGDKRETAINIAHSSRICTPKTALFQLDVEDGDLEWQISDILTSPDRQAAPHSAIVIDGQTLTALEQPEAARLRKTFFTQLIPTVGSVICCRASPSQKALLVRAVRDEPSPPPGTTAPGRAWWWVRTSFTSHRRPLTLAIGDGANDLAMITAANVGVGISGREGQQAARVADISIAQFRFLSRLLLVHGRWNYHRITRFVLGSFWKETMFWFPAALYQIAAGFTGTSLYESTALTVYGFAFSTACTMTIGAWEKDLKARTLMAVPELYAYGQRAQGLNWGVFLSWIANAVLAGTAISFLAWLGYGGAYTTTPDDNGLYAIGTLVFIACMVWTNVKILILEMQYKTILVLLIFCAEIALIWLFHIVVGYVFTSLVISPYSVVDGFIRNFGGDAAWWATLALVLGGLFTVELSVAALRQRFAGSLNQVWRTNEGRDHVRAWDTRLWKEIERDRGCKARLEEIERDRGCKARLEEMARE